MKKKYINKIFALLISVICLGILPGCASAFGNSSDKLVLALRSGTYSEVIRQCIPGFEEKYGITCEIKEFGEDELYNAILNNSLVNKSDYDLCMVDGSWMAEFMDSGVLSNLTGLGYSFDDDIIPATTKVCYHDGEVYLAPYYGNVTVMLYNRDLLEGSGLSDGIKTWNDVMTLSKYAEEQGINGYIYRGDTENNVVVDFLPILCAHGGWVIDSDNNPTVDTPEFHAAMEYYMELISTGAAMDKETMINSIETGSGCTGVGWPGWVSTDKESNTDFVAIPTGISDSDPDYNSNIYGIWTIGIPANSGNRDNACERLKYLMDPEIQKSTVENEGVPCRYSSLRDPEIFKLHPHFTEICNALENGVYRPIIKEWPQFYQYLGKEMADILNGKQSIEDGLAIAQHNLEALMGTG